MEYKDGTFYLSAEESAATGLPEEFPYHEVWGHALDLHAKMSEAQQEAIHQGIYREVETKEIDVLRNKSDRLREYATELFKLIHANSEDPYGYKLIEAYVEIYNKDRNF